MNLNNIFKKDREEKRKLQIDSAKQAMTEAGSLFDVTIQKLYSAQRQIDEAQHQ